MANYNLSPNMNLPIPTVGVDPGPDWANNIDVCLTTLDGHTHNSGSGVKITPSGININDNLAYNGNNAIGLRTTRFSSQSAVLTDPTDLGAVYNVLGNLYWNNGAGVAVKITDGASVAGSSGTITGLPSGTASAAYRPGSGTFEWLQATSTPANMDNGNIILRYVSYPSPTGNFVELSASPSLATGYQLVFPSGPTATVNSFLYITNVGAGTLDWARPDTGTIIIDGVGVLRVPAQGIANINIADATILTGKIAANTILGGTSGNIAGNTISHFNLTSGSSGFGSGSAGYGTNNTNAGTATTIDAASVVCTGRMPVQVSLISSGPNQSNPSSIFVNFNALTGGAQTQFGYIQLVKDGSLIRVWRYGNTIVNVNTDPGSVDHFFSVNDNVSQQIPSYVDPSPSAGSHTYTFKGYVSNAILTLNVFNFEAVAYEIA